MSRALRRQRWKGIPRSPGTLIPDFMSVDMRYYTYFPWTGGNVTTVVATKNVHDICAIGMNCLWDPYLLLGGHQPAYFDTLTSMYETYIVTDSWVNIQPNNYAQTQMKEVYYFNVPPNIYVPNPTITITQVLEQPETFHPRYKMMGISTVDPQEKFHLEWHLAEHDPQTPITEHIVDIDGWCGSATANPTFVAGMGQMNIRADGGGDVLDVYTMVEIKFRVVWGWPLINVIN